MEVYGDQFEVRLLNEYVTAFYAVRMMSIKNLKAKSVVRFWRIVSSSNLVDKTHSKGICETVLFMVGSYLKITCPI